MIYSKYDKIINNSLKIISGSKIKIQFRIDSVKKKSVNVQEKFYFLAEL